MKLEKAWKMLINQANKFLTMFALRAIPLPEYISANISEQLMK